MSDIDLDAVVALAEGMTYRGGDEQDLGRATLDLVAEVRRLREVREEWRRLYSNAVAERDGLRAQVEAVRHILSSGYADFQAFQADLRAAVALDVVLDAATADVEGMARVLTERAPVECSHSGRGFSDRWWLCEACGWASEKRARLDTAEAFAHQAHAIRD